MTSESISSVLLLVALSLLAYGLFNHTIEVLFITLYGYFIWTFLKPIKSE